MAFHDTIEFPGPKKVVEELVYKSKNFRNVRFVGSITLAKKVGQNSIKDRLRSRYVHLLRNLHEFGVRLHLPKPITMIGRKLLKLIQ